MRPTVVLFDIDGTLLSCGGAGGRAMARAFARLYGAPEAANFAYAGRTDQGILAEALGRAGQPVTPARVAEVAAVYLELLAEELPRSAGFSVLPGVEAVLAGAPPGPLRAVGLGTGNLEPAAWLKVRQAGLHGRFEFGGFGGEHADRAEVLRRGAARGAARLGRAVAGCRVVVVGDTPRDVAAAAAIGAECVAVATGPYPAEALAGASLVAADLTDGRVAAALRG